MSHSHKKHCRSSGFWHRTARTVIFLILALAVFGAGCFLSHIAMASGRPPELPEVGFRSIGVWVPETELRMDIAVWYPGRRIPRNLTLDGWIIRVGKDSQPLPARYPVILISHDTSASRLAVYDLAAHLAQQGFLVIAPTHTGDNTNDISRLFRAAIFVERPYHLIIALDAVAASPILAPLVDRSRVGLLGVGSGAATALQLVGAEPDLGLLTSYCTPEDINAPLCSSWAKTFHPRMQQEFTALSVRAGKGPFAPFFPRQLSPSLLAPLLTETPALLPGTARPTASSAQETLPSPEQDPPPLAEPKEKDTVTVPTRDHLTWNTQRDPADRQPVLAVGLLAPGQIRLFPDHALRAVTVPVGIIGAANDTVYPVATGVARLQELLPNRPAFRVLQDSSHADLLPPCPPMYTESFPSLCGETGPDAPAARKTRNEFFTRFYKKILGEPLVE